MIWWRDTLKTWSAKVGSEKHNNILPKKIFFFMTLLNVKGDLKCGASWSFWRVGIRGMQEFFFFPLGGMRSENVLIIEAE